MSISSSLNAGVTGLNVNASKLATISDNISNSKTYGYKRADVEFSALAIGASGGSYTAGGVFSSSYRAVDSQGALATTSNPLDIAIGGGGFLPVTSVASAQANASPMPLQLTSTGSFQPDESGLVRTSSGLALMGWPADLNGVVASQPRDSVTGLEPVQINYGQFAANRTDAISMGANLPATATQAGSSGTPYTIDVEYFDNLGAPQTLTTTFTPTVPGVGSSNTWTMVMTDSDSGGAVVADFTIVFDNSAAAGGSILTVTPNAGPATFNAVTGLISMNVNGGPIDVEIGIPGTSAPMTKH